MSLQAAVDSTCLIGLERNQQLDFLPKLFTRAYVPPVVVAELGHSVEWLIVKEVSNKALLKALSTQLGAGESAVIALATEVRNAVAVLDDKKARRVAREMGLRMMGTIGLLVKAKLEGVVSQLGPLLGDLDGAGFHLSPELHREALRLAGEEGS